VSPSAAAPAATPSAPQAGKPAPVSHVVNIQRADCRNLLRLSPNDRAAAAMFYIGYQASRLRASTIDVAVIPSIEAQAFVYCQENPDEPLVRAFAAAYSAIKWWSTRHLIGVKAAPLENGEVEAKTAFLVYRSHLETTILKQDSPADVLDSIYFVFERINSGGIRLSPRRSVTA
jgi:HdeA/HdeB family